MMARSTLLALALVSCTRAASTNAAHETAVIDVAVIAHADAFAPSPDASRALGVFAMQSSTCTNLTELSSAFDRARAAGARALSCTTDASVAFTIPLDDAGHPASRALAKVLRLAWGDMPASDRREALQFLDRGAPRGSVVSFDEFDRSRAALSGRVARVEGRIIDAQTEGEDTRLTIAVRGHESAPLSVIYPASVERWMARGARVRGYGIWAEENQRAVLFASLLLAQ